MVEILQGPKNWHTWIISFLSIDYEVWKLVDPSKENKSAFLPRPTKPTCKDVNFAATDIGDLNKTELQELAKLNAEFCAKYEGYESQQKALAEMRQHIIQSVGKYQYLISNEHSVAKQLSILAKNAKPTDEEYKQMISDQYYAALGAPAKSSCWSWYMDWVGAYTKAKHVGLLFSGEVCATRQLLQAFASIDSNLGDHYEIKMEELAQTGDLDWHKSMPSPIEICKHLASVVDIEKPTQKSRSVHMPRVFYESQTTRPRPSRQALILPKRPKSSEHTELQEQAYRDQLEDLYYDLFQGINGHRLDDYLQNWRKVISECRRLEMTMILNDSLVYSFLRTTVQIFPSFCFYWKMKRFDKEGDKAAARLPDPIALSEIFERCYKRRVLGQIDATFGFEPRSYDFKLYQPPNSTQRPPQPAKTSKPAGSPKSPCLCGMGHFYTQCFYLVDEIRPLHWIPYTDVASMVLKQLKTPSVKARVLRAMDRAKKKTGRRPKEVSLPTATHSVRSDGE